MLKTKEKFYGKNYFSPTKEQIEYICKTLKPRRMEMVEYGLRFGIASCAIGIMIILIMIGISKFSSIIFPLIFLDAGIFSIIGGIRSKKEADCYEKGEFVLRQGKVKEIQKRNCWSTTVTIEYNNTEEIELFNFIGKPVDTNDNVYIVLADKKKIKWAVPRICKR